MKPKNEIDGISKCMAVLIFSTCVITACSSGDDDENVLQLSLTILSSAPLGERVNVSASEYVENGLCLINIGQRGNTNEEDSHSPEAAPELSITRT
ncbi:hypothetical protein [Alteromonas sp. S015]|uniref:hypothetical protein n=1 Tax=Alteromonas sp. S015 TaxID=3117401 RepID=UPI002FE32413